MHIGRLRFGLPLVGPSCLMSGLFSLSLSSLSASSASLEYDVLAVPPEVAKVDAYMMLLSIWIGLDADEGRLSTTVLPNKPWLMPWSDDGSAPRVTHPIQRRALMVRIPNGATILASALAPDPGFMMMPLPALTVALP